MIIRHTQLYTGVLEVIDQVLHSCETILVLVQILEYSDNDPLLAGVETFHIDRPDLTKALQSSSRSVLSFGGRVREVKPAILQSRAD